MNLKIKTTGIEQWLPDGEAHLKMMVIGGPGVGKTRYSSFWPKPIYADCEAGLASVADRNVPYVTVETSEDMLSLLAHLKRTNGDGYGTLVIDTLDAFQRKVKDEWLRANRAAAFSGYEAWGYLEAKIQMLMTRALSLPMNVVFLVHYKEKAGDKDEPSTFSLQLQGSIKDEAFNDFDLVGWMGSYFDVDKEGQRVQKRGLTFEPTPQKPFLKDRLHITPKWLEVNFEEADYSRLFERFLTKLDDLTDGGVVGEVPEFNPDTDVEEPAEVSDNVVTPESIDNGGALPPEDARPQPLEQLTKPELMDKAKEMGADVKSSMKKAEVVAAIEAAADSSSGSAPDDQETPATDVADDAEPTEATESADVGELLAKELDAEPEESPATPVASAPAVADNNSSDVCGDCGGSTAGTTPDHQLLVRAKSKTFGWGVDALCADCYAARKRR